MHGATPHRPSPFASTVRAMAELGPVIVSFDRASGRIEARVALAPDACGDISDRHLGVDGASRDARRVPKPM